MRYTAINVEMNHKQQVKVSISGYFGEDSLDQFVYFSVELTTEQAQELYDALGTRMQFHGPQPTVTCVTETFIRNPLALNDDALGENPEPVALTQADGVGEQ